MDLNDTKTPKMYKISPFCVISLTMVDLQAAMSPTNLEPDT